MAHEIHLKNNKYRQWVKAGLGLGYLKEGLAPFCDDIGRQQHNDIINKIQQTKTPQPNIPCGTCQITTLQPDHVRVSKGICPLNQDKCNCCFPNNKRPCPNNVCGAIYDSIIQYHASMPPAPFWKNSDVQQWSTDPWNVCKCFINAPGYKDKTSAVDTDCTGLLHVIINNKYFHSHIGCNVTGPNNLFSKVRQYRNEIFHSSNMELEESKANCYIDDMIAVLQDGKELIHQQDAQQAVGKLQDLKKKEFIITTEDFEEILTQIKEEMRTENAATKEELEVLKSKLTELKAHMSEAEKERTELKRKFTALETEQKEQIKRLKVEDSPQQKQLEFEKAKSEWRKKLIEEYHKILLQVPTTPLQPKREKCSFNEIYIRPKITREIQGEKGEITEKELTSMSEIFTKNGILQKSVYLVGDAGSGKTSFCKYLVNCWCLAHSEEHEADNENENGRGKPEGDSEKHGCDGEKHGAGNENEGGSSKPEGDSEKHGGDDEKYVGVNENEDGSSKPEDDSGKHGIDDEKHESGGVNDNEGGTEKQGGDFEEHEKKGSDTVNEEVKGTHSGDIENEEGSKTHGVVIEKRGDEKHLGGIKKNGSDSDDIQDNSDGLIHSKSHNDDSDDILNDSKSDNDDSDGESMHSKSDSDDTDDILRGSKTHGGVNEKGGDEKQVDGIKKNGSDSDDIQGNSFDLIHTESHNNDSDFHSDDSDGDLTYFEFDNDDSDDDSIHSKSDIYDSDDILTGFKFNSDGSGDSLNDYIVKDIFDSDADLTHSVSDSVDSVTDLTEFYSDVSEYDSKYYELKFNGVKEMKEYDFVFYIPLRQYQKIDTIDEMLQNRYQMKMLNTLLEEESSRVMILLDGLDEWANENVPEHSIFKEYTIVTTSRPWKFHTLRSSDVEIEQSLKLKGFDFRCEREMINRTVSQLNVKRHANKEAGDCRKKLEEESLESLKQVPIMLQQLICLWFDGKLDKTSRCAIYTGMLELFFTWNDMKTTRTSTRLMKGTQKVNLPQYLVDKTKLKLNCHFIYEVSQLAYETLFNCPKDKSLTFDICMFDELEISDEVRENCLKLGIMTEDECPSLSVSEPPSSLFSFIHKSMQEFLAAVNICINFNAKIGSSDSTGNVELAKKFFYEVFQNCSTVNDILEQSNVIIMLSGLEPRLATHVSKYIYDTVSEDCRVQVYRRTIRGYMYRDHSFITDLQKLMFDSMEEFNASCSVGSNPVFYIGDLVLERWGQYCDSDDCDIVCSRDGEEFNDDMLQGNGGGKRNDARQYVKDNVQLFHVKRDDDCWLNFST
ncbi:uncharacterized protein LOC132731982 [Ruditapes philippinarum]|uniref:uncharacterized protein LOC132731982 n=1 Tax=Ruditapes philippinarum TaxID=129788 RepID=UPI00295B1615|nr:uncharacterized protein LOC132731982 [Ruditapes philippinarum]